MSEVLGVMGDDLLVLLDDILRVGVSTYASTPPHLLIEHDKRAQANATYAHIVAEAERRFESAPGVRFVNIRGLKLWWFREPNVVVSFKKMNKYGGVQRHDSIQQRNFDYQRPLEGIPPEPTRLRVGYLLDEMSGYVRTQVASPNGKRMLWCAAVQPPEFRTDGQAIWYDVAEQIQLDG